VTVRPCPGLPGEPCGILVPASARRCEPHRLIAERSSAPRGAAWSRLSRRIIGAHRRDVGPWCPGAPELDHDAHPSFDLTVDHIDGDSTNNDPRNLRVLCRAANTSAMRRSRPPTPPRGHPLADHPSINLRPPNGEKT